MKEIEEFLKEIESSEALQNELKAINDKDALEELLKKYDVNETDDEFAKALKAIAEGEISDGAAESVAGAGDDDLLKEWYCGSKISTKIVSLVSEPATGVPAFHGRRRPR